MTALEIIAVIVVGAAAATVQGSIGIGFTLVAGPALVSIDPGFAPGPLLLTGQLVGARHIIAERAEADIATWRRCMIGLPVGLAAALLVLETMDRRSLSLMVGGLTALAAAAMLTGVQTRRSGPADVVAGGACTFAAVSAGLPGPPLAVAFSDMRPATLRSTASMVIAVIATLGLAALVATGNFTTDDVRLLAYLLPGAAIGLGASRFVRPHLERPAFRPLILMVALAGGLALVWKQM